MSFRVRHPRKPLHQPVLDLATLAQQELKRYSNRARILSPATKHRSYLKLLED